MYDGFLASPSKRRRHSDSNVTLALPTPRGNMKGSLSLEGEAQRCDTTAQSGATEPSPGPSLEWTDPYSPSPTSPLSSPYKFDVPGQEDSALRPNCPARVNLTTRMESDSGSGSSGGGSGRQVIVKRVGAGHPGLGSGGSQMSVDGEGEEDTDSHSVISFVKTSQDSLELASVFSEEARDSPAPVPSVCVERPASSAGVAGESDMKRSRKMWYKHKHFSTPVHDDDKQVKVDPKPPLGPRSSSLPLPEPRPASPPLSPGPALPLITVSSPSDPASAESQVSDETNVTAVLSNSDLDVMAVDEVPQPPDRPSVICGPAERTSCLKTTRRRDNEVEVVTLDQQSL